MTDKIDMTPELTLDPTGAAQAAAYGQIQQQGQVRRKAACGRIVKAAQIFRIQTAPVALVGQGGIGVAVAEHNLPGLQGGADDFGHMLGPVGQKKKELRPAGKPARAAIQQNGTQTAAQVAAPRFTGEHGVQPVVRQVGGQRLHDCGFAGALYAFKRDKHSSFTTFWGAVLGGVVFLAAGCGVCAAR